MLILVTYDVSTETSSGRRRLRRIAKICESVGQRVQKSVFECQVNQMQYEELERKLVAEMDQEEDNLRLYRLTEHSATHVKEFGLFRATQFDEPLLV